MLMRLTSVPSVRTLWLMANALVLPIHSLTHAHTQTDTPNAFLLGFACKCARPRARVMPKHFCGHDPASQPRRISIILGEKSPVIQPLSSVTDKDVSEGWKMRG